MTTTDRFVSIQDKRIMGFLDFRDRFLDYIKAQLTQIVSVAYGDDGTVGGTITFAHFGSGQNRFQLSNDIVGSDGQGHFTLGTAELAGRDVGLRFANVNTVDYFVAYHYTERPRGIQVNPRTGFPEFLEFEETLGNRADPDLVTDNGNGTITFRVNSVARLFGADAALDQTGRRCLVWKKTPGREAITEAAAVELCTISLVSTHNVITTTSDFGQSTVSTLASDYYVLLLGATVSLQDLSAETGYHFIGTVTGAGLGNPPTYDTTGQNNIGPLISDINVISSIHHGNRKLRVQADNSDVDETQLEISGRPDAGGPLVFSVDEDGDVFALGNTSLTGNVSLGTGASSAISLGASGATSTIDQRAASWRYRNSAATVLSEILQSGTDFYQGIGGVAESGFTLKTYGPLKLGTSHDTDHELRGIFSFRQTAGAESASLDSETGVLLLGTGAAGVSGDDTKLRADPDAQINQTLYIGTAQNADSVDNDGTIPRFDFQTIGANGASYSLQDKIGTGSQIIRRFLISGVGIGSNVMGTAITINAARINSTNEWDKDVNGVAAVIYHFAYGQFMTGLRLAANDANWTSWDSVNTFGLAGDPTGLVTLFGNLVPTATGQDLGTTSARWDAFLRGLNVSDDIVASTSGIDVATAVTPFASLYANNLIQTGSGGFLFNTRKTYRKVLTYRPTAVEFTASNGTFDVVNGTVNTNAAYLEFNESFAGESCFVDWPLQLPDGAIITGITAHWRTGGSIPASVVLGAWRQSNQGPVGAKAFFSATGGGFDTITSPAASTDRNDSLTLTAAAAVAPIDNNLYAYFVTIDFADNADAARFYSIEVTYTLGEL